MVKVTRAKLESLVEELVERTMGPCKTAIEDAGVRVSEIDEVILVGGQTRMPLVQQRVKQFFDREPRKDVNPDEAVAIGASIQGGVLSSDIKDVLLLDVTPLSLGIETLGGVMTPLIEKNTTIPTRKNQTFSTAENNQPAVTIHVLQGERKQASQNKSLGQFDLTGIPPAPRGVPQIEVSFDIDANDILNVRAVDKATNKEQSIVIKASSGLSDDEVKQMVRDAESHSAEDAKFAELVTLRNQADSMIHSARKMLEDSGDKVSEPEKTAITTAIESLEQAVQTDNKDEIEAKLQELNRATEPVVQRMYQEAQAQPNPESAGATTDEPPPETEEPSAGDDDVVDAEFEEVKNDK